MSKRLTPRQESWIYLNVIVTLLLLVVYGFKVAIIEFLSVGIVMNIIKLILDRPAAK